MNGDKASELAPATPTNGTKLQRTASSLGGSHAPLSRVHSTLSTAVIESQAPRADEDAAAMIKSFRRKRYIRTRLLMPLAGDEQPPTPARRVTKPSPRASPRRTLPIETQSIIANLPPSDQPQLENDDTNNRLEDDDDVATTSLQRVHALLASQDEIMRWISTYETERAAFSSFALFTEMKLDQIQDRYVGLAGRPNAVEAAACCATLLKMPGIVGCYATLLNKLARGLDSVVYVPELASIGAEENQPMSTLVQSFFRRKPYFQLAAELQLKLSEAKSLTDPHVLQALTVDELKSLALQIPVRHLTAGIVAAYALHLPHLDFLLTAIHEKKHQLQLDFYAQHGRRKGPGAATNSPDGDDLDIPELDDPDNPDPRYPVSVPLASSAQICRAISAHAAGFSSSGKEMVMCSILEHIDVDSFKDVFKRFDAHGKTCFLHHLGVLESSDHLQLILEALPNPGETLFRFYYVICGGNSANLQGNPKHVFFHKVLSAEMEFFFLCDLAAYLNEEQWTLLAQEYDKHAKERKAKRRRQRRQRTRVDGDEDGEDDENPEDGDDDGGSDDEGHGKKAPAPPAAGASLEHFQLMVWNYLHHHKCTSAQIWSLLQASLLPSLEETEQLGCIDFCMDHLPLSNRWKKLLAMVEDMEADSSSSSTGDVDSIRHSRVKLLKRVFAMLTREERISWMDKTTAKYGVLTAKPAPPPPRKPVAVEMPVVPVVAKPVVVNLDDPTTWLPTMKLDTKMLWIEALLHAMANDKETSARTMMLKQVLVPFLNGQTPAPPVASEPKTLSLPEAEKAITAVLAKWRVGDEIVLQDEAKLWKRLVPESVWPLMQPVKARTDRGESPIPELDTPLTTVAAPAPAPVAAPLPPVLTEKPWYETATTNSEVATALRKLLESKSEDEVLRILRDAGENKPFTPVMEQKVDEEEQSASTAGSFRNAVKRKVSAVVTIAQPMEWQERVKVGMLDEATQTDDPPTEKPTLVSALPEEKRPALSLSALLGRSLNGAAAATPGKKKGDTKYQKLVSTSVPKSISGLITSWRVNTDQLIQFAKKSMPTVLRLIADAYGEMLTAGRRKANFQAAVQTVLAGTRGSGVLKELTLAQIVYQQFLHSYGLPGIADMHLLAFSCALENFRQQHLRVEFFARFVFEEVPKLELLNFLEFLECLVCEDTGMNSSNASSSGSSGSGGNASNANAAATQGPVTTKRQRFVPRVIVPDKENWTVPLERAQEAAQLCFRAMRKQAVTAFCDKLVALATQGVTGYIPGAGSLGAIAPIVGSGSDSGRTSPGPYALTSGTSPAPTVGVGEGLVLNADHLLQLVVEEWREEQLRREGHLLNVFRAGDVNGDGELTSAEFTHIVLAIDHTRDQGDILLMYSDTLRRTESDSIDAETFLQVAKEYELDRAAWNEDGDLRNIVNDMSELQQTWSHTRRFFLGTLEALVRDLPSQHFLRVCEGAGCGCLKCILDGYIGFQRMRKDYTTSMSNPRGLVGVKHRSNAVVSEALLWARFWHLMRQLYDAASESAGILTAWEGADYMRVEAAPRPPPRYLKYRRMAVPHFLFPDPVRISGVISKTLDQDPEVFDRDGILEQFSSLMELMSYSNGVKNALGAK